MSTAEIEYLKKKLEALEQLYLAEKERVETLQYSIDDFKGKVKDLAVSVDNLSNHLRGVPYPNVRF